MGRDTESAETLQRVLVAGSIVCVATLAAAALRGRADSGSAIAPINATSHVIFGSEAGNVAAPSFKHTILGFVINAGASVFWASVYQRLFDRVGQRGGAGTSVVGGAAVAALAYLVDYQLIPQRLTPGWEYRVSGRSLAMIFGAMAASLPLRRVLASVLTSRHHRPSQSPFASRSQVAASRSNSTSGNPASADSRSLSK